MRVVQLVAVTLLITGAAAASFTIWQIVDTTAAEPELRGPAPVLIGDAPPPATSMPIVSALSATATVSLSPESTPVAPTATAVSIARNLVPATGPVSTPVPAGTQPVGTPATDEPAVGGAVHSDARQQPPPGALPTYLRVPRIDIEPLIVPVGLNERGEMASPADYFQVGWWQHGVAPGDYGRAVIAGHVDTPTGEAVFYGIDRLAPGDEIFVGSEGGAELRFVVTGAALYHIDHVPLEQIFGPSTERELILITCGGWYDHEAEEYLYRRVVFATLAG